MSHATYLTPVNTDNFIKFLLKSMPESMKPEAVKPNVQTANRLTTGHTPRYPRVMLK